MIGKPSPPDALTTAPGQPDCTYALGDVRFLTVAGTIYSLAMILIGVAGLLPRAIIAGLPDWLVGATSAFGSVLVLIAEHPIMGYGLIWVGISTGAVIFWVALKLVRQQRPLAINDFGVFAYYRGHPWRFLAWRDVKVISKELSRRGRQQFVTFRIVGPEFALPMTNRISRFGDALAVLERYARKHGIRLQQVDMTASRKGVVTAVTELK